MIFHFRSQSEHDGERGNHRDRGPAGIDQEDSTLFRICSHVQAAPPYESVCPAPCSRFMGILHVLAHRSWTGTLL